MTTASVIGSFVKPGSIVGAGYWLHIEQVLPEDDTASLGEVAELVDEIWGTDPCNQTEEPAAEQTTETGEAKPPVSEEKFAEIVRTQFRAGLCGMNINGDYATQIKVAVSHPGERYTLRLTNGRIGKTVTVEEPLELTIVVKDAASVDLDFPVVSGGTFTWRGSVYGKSGNMTGPPISLSGRALSWGQPLTGSIAVSGRTRYDLVDVTVLGDEEGEPGECRAICFFHGLIDEIDLQPPDVDNDDGLEIYRQPFCGHGTLVMGDPNDDEVTCYEDISYVYRCQCSGEEAYQHTEYQVVVPCPPGIRCQFGLDKCWSFMGHRTVLGGYVDCGETSGGLDDPDFRGKVCCDQAASLPKCQTTYAKNPGGVPLDPEIEKEYRRIYKDKLRIVAVSPDDGDCGVTKTVVAVRPKNCCAEAEPIAWDFENSIEVLADSSSGMVYVTGGVPPYYWSVRGQGFTFDDYNMRDAVTDVPRIRVFANEYACGYAAIEVTDGCSVVVGGVRSTVGVWALLISSGSGGPPQCYITGACSMDHVGSGATSFEAIRGKYKISISKAYETVTNAPAFSTLTAAQEGCSQFRAEKISWVDTNVCPNNNQCTECMDGDGYIPCELLATVDDQYFINHCDQNVFSYIQQLSGWYYTWSRYAYTAGYSVREWRC